MQGGNRAAITAGYHDDLEMDRAQVEDGDMDTRRQPALSLEELNENHFVSLLRTDPFADL